MTWRLHNILYIGTYRGVECTKWSNMCSWQTALIMLSSLPFLWSIAQQIQSKTRVIDPSETHVCFLALLTMLWGSFRDNVYLCYPSVYHIAVLKPDSKADLPLENQAFRSCSIWDLFLFFFLLCYWPHSYWDPDFKSLPFRRPWSNTATSYMSSITTSSMSSITLLSNLFHCPAAIKMSGKKGPFAS